MARSEAEAATSEGNNHADNGEHEAARLAYENAARLDPSWAVPWFNIGLLHKQRCEWLEAIQANQRALEREADHEGALWNLGIAATAMGDWVLARKAWSDYGIQIPEGEGPLTMKLGPTPIRVEPHGNAEVVWSQRIDPCRAVIASIPFRSSGHRFNDLILHDGAPNGTRRLGEREIPVFDELQRLEASPWDTFVAEVVFPEGAMEVLHELAQQAGGSAEDWTSSTRTLCRACSEGRPDHDPSHEHEAGAARATPDTHQVAIAAIDREQAAGLLKDWEQRVEGIEVHWLDEGFASEDSE